MDDVNNVENQEDNNSRISELIKSSLGDDYNKANQIFGDIMTIKLSDVLDQEKVNMASKIYNDVPEEEGEMPEVEDESELEAGDDDEILDDEIGEDEDEVDEGDMRGAAEDEMDDDMDMGDDDMDMEADMDDGDDIEVDVPESDAASLRTARDVLDQILAALDGGDEEMEDDDMDMGDEDLDAEEPLDGEESLEEVDQEELEEVAERIANRVAKKIQEALQRKVKEAKKD